MIITNAVNFSAIIDLVGWSASSNNNPTTVDGGTMKLVRQGRICSITVEGLSISSTAADFCTLIEILPAIMIPSVSNGGLRYESANGHWFQDGLGGPMRQDTIIIGQAGTSAEGDVTLRAYNTSGAISDDNWSDRTVTYTV